MRCGAHGYAHASSDDAHPADARRGGIEQDVPRIGGRVGPDPGQPAGGSGTSGQQKVADILLQNGGLRTTDLSGDPEDYINRLRTIASVSRKQTYNYEILNLACYELFIIFRVLFRKRARKSLTKCARPKP